MTLVVIGGFMMFWLRAHRSREIRGGCGGGGGEREDRFQIRVAREDEALDLVKRALANRDPGKVESFFHLGGASPDEVVEFIAGSEARDGRIERYDWLSSMDVEGLADGGGAGGLRREGNHRRTAGVSNAR